MGLNTLGETGGIGVGGAPVNIGIFTALSQGMNAAYGLPNQFRGDVQIYTTPGLVGAPSYVTWRKPKNASWVQMLCIAGGGGGGGGFTRGGGNPGGGGGSGACSGIQRFHCAAMFLPDILYVQAGVGGLGGASGSAGSPGTNSYIVTSSRIVAPTLPNIICYSGVNAPGGGGAGAAGSGGAAGAVPTISIAQPWHLMGDAGYTVGAVGLVGGAQTGANGGSITAWNGLVLSPGASGGGCTAADFNGGDITAGAALDLGDNGFIPATAGGIALHGTPSAPPTCHGSAGFSMWSPFLQSGGAGGATNNGGTAGDGGRGGIGCGGGGGGAGTAGGRGGNGGNGLVVIVSI